MGKTIKKIKVTSFVLIVLELLIVSGLCIIYFNNFFSIQDIISYQYLILIFVGLLSLDCLFIWFTTLAVAKLRNKTDLHAAEIIGGDVQEAYNFAMVGLVVTDESDIILWTNDLFKERHIDIIDLNIFDWMPDLRALKESSLNGEGSKKVFFNSRNYDVKYLPEAGLWIFKDSTDYEALNRTYENESPVIGILTIDNYEDAIRGETEDYNDVATKVKNAIFLYAKEYKLLLRKFKDDSYQIICNAEALEAMRKDDFSIVDTVRRIGIEENCLLTISIGIAHNFPDVIRLNEMAAEALDMAMSRGGDQTVLSTYGQEIQFFGGKTEAQEKRNKVKVRVLADSFMGLIKASSNVLIMGHKDMDMDALGAALGVKALCDKAQKNARIVVDLKLTEYKTRSALTTSFSKDELDELKVTPKDAIDLVKSDTLLVVVDVHRPKEVMAPNLLDRCAKVVVIDHHRRSEEYIESPVLNYIDPSASSASELITDFIHYVTVNPRVELPPIYATIMLSGIFLDSQNFKSNHTGIRTFEACTILKEYGADNAMADDFLKDEKEEYFTIVDMMKTVKFPTYGIALIVADPEREYDRATLAKVANTCLTMKGVKASFVLGRVDKTIRASCRSDGTVNVQLLAEKLGGGGHFTMAAIAFENKDIKEAEQDLINVLNKYLNVARADAKARKTIEED